MKFQLPLVFAVSASIGLLLSSCNTWVGMGRDFQSLGGGVKKMGSGMENQAYKNTGYTAPAAR